MYSCREDIGNTILLELFQIAPDTKEVFGFSNQSDPMIKNNIKRSNPILQMGLMVHGLQIVTMIDQILDLLGPDTDILHDVLQEQVLIRQHETYGMKVEYFLHHMGIAIRNAFLKLLDRHAYTTEVDQSWKELFDVLCTTTITPSH
jgi:hypothetical protein